MDGWLSGGAVVWSYGDWMSLRGTTEGSDEAI